MCCFLLGRSCHFGFVFCFLLESLLPALISLRCDSSHVRACIRLCEMGHHDRRPRYRIKCPAGQSHPRRRGRIHRRVRRLFRRNLQYRTGSNFCSPPLSEYGCGRSRRGDCHFQYFCHIVFPFVCPSLSIFHLPA